MRKLIAGGLSVLGLTSCASPGVPPGAPERNTPPAVLQLVPDTNSVKVNARYVVVQFDAVVSERPVSPGAQSLADLVTLSPRHGDIDVDWKRSQIRIRPKRGWKDNTTYSIQIAPGIADLQGNVRDSTITLVFSTGPTLDSTFVRGIVFDWVSGAPVSGAVVEAVPRPDSSSVYIAHSDSEGYYSIRVPNNQNFTVRASINTLQERAFDARMAYDTSYIAFRDSAFVELLAYTHDTVGPTLGAVRPVDSVTLEARFAGLIDPLRFPGESQLRLFDADSNEIDILSITPSTLMNVETDTVTEIDSTDIILSDTLARDTVSIDTTGVSRVEEGPLKPGKPLLFRELIIVTAVPLQSESDYVLRAFRFVNPDGHASDSEMRFKTPPAPPPPEATDSAAVERPSSEIQ